MMNQSQNLGSQRLTGAASQYAASNAESCSSLPGESADLSPVAYLLTQISDELGYAHNAVSVLDNRVTPIRACSPEEGKASVSPKAIAATAMEQKLDDILETVRFLSSRIRRMEAELRI